MFGPAQPAVGAVVRRAASTRSHCSSRTSAPRSTTTVCERYHSGSPARDHSGPSLTASFSVQTTPSPLRQAAVSVKSHLWSNNDDPDTANDPVQTRPPPTTAIRMHRGPRRPKPTSPEGHRGGALALRPASQGARRQAYDGDLLLRHHRAQSRDHRLGLLLRRGLHRHYHSGRSRQTRQSLPVGASRKPAHTRVPEIGAHQHHITHTPSPPMLEGVIEHHTVGSR